MDVFGAVFCVGGLYYRSFSVFYNFVANWTDECQLHAMNVYPVHWNKPVLVEAYKFWFYALALSIVGALWGLLFGSAPASDSASGGKVQQDEKKGGSSKERKVSAKPLVKRIVVDGCDLLIPGVFLGWIQVSEVVVGMAMVVSTVVAGRDIWIKAQQG